MIHINLFLYLLSFIAAAVSITGSIVFYLQYHKKVLVYYSLMLGVAVLLLFHRMLQLYCGTMHLEHHACTPFLIMAVEKAALCLAMFAGPVFMHHLLGLDLSQRKRRFYLALAVLYTLFAAAEIATAMLPVTKIIRYALSMPLLFGMYGYCLVVVGLSLGKLGSRLLKNVVWAVFGISLLILPFSLFQYSTQISFLPGFMERPLLFLALFMLTLFFSIRHFNHPAYLENQRLTQYFRDHFSITERECDIIQRVILGDSNQIIGEKLFISMRTVESHLYSIFQKLGVKNRVQLANLIQTNKL
jgi:DNA-binding CsgD family transcriptional regulator